MVRILVSRTILIVHHVTGTGVIVQLACTLKNHKDMSAHPMIGLGRLSEGRSEGVGPGMEAGEPLEGRSNSNDEVSISHGCSGQY